MTIPIDMLKWKGEISWALPIDKELQVANDC